MTIQEIKDYMKKEKITYQALSDKSGIPLNTIKNIFRGKTENPRIDTMQAIERALGIAEEVSEYSEDEKKLLALIAEMTDEETQELSNYIDFIISKRR